MGQWPNLRDSNVQMLLAIEKLMDRIDMLLAELQKPKPAPLAKAKR